MVRMLVVLLGHLVDLQILGETRLPVEHVKEIRETPPYVLWWASTETSSATSASLSASASSALLKPLGLKNLVASSHITCIERHCVQLRNDLM